MIWIGMASGVKLVVAGETSSTSSSSCSRSLYEGLASLPFTRTSSASISRCSRARLQFSICDARKASSRTPTSSGPILNVRLSWSDPSTILAFKLFHERNQRFDSVSRKRVVDRCADAADGAMTLQTIESLRRRLSGELLLQLFGRQTKRDVHRRATIGV